ASRIQPMPNRLERLLGFGALPSSGEFDTLICIQHYLTNPDSLRSDFYTFIVAHPFQGFFQTELTRWGEPSKRIGGGCTHVGLLLFADDVDVHALVARVFAEDHAFISFRSGLDKE